MGAECLEEWDVFSMKQKTEMMRNGGEMEGGTGGNVLGPSDRNIVKLCGSETGGDGYVRILGRTFLTFLKKKNKRSRSNQEKVDIYIYLSACHLPVNPK